MAINISSAKFVKGITGTNDILYDGKFHVAFMGRSNVGKSSLINSLTLRRDLAHSSSHPGRTIRMDFFEINNSFYFVDFPGYGFAKRSSEQKEKISKMILWYLLYSDVRNRCVVLIIDAKVGYTAFDVDMMRILQKEHIPYIIVANKIDNLKIGEKEKQFARILSDSQNLEVIAYSSKVKRGRNELLNAISTVMTHVTS